MKKTIKIHLKRIDESVLNLRKKPKNDKWSIDWNQIFFKCNSCCYISKAKKFFLHIKNLHNEKATFKEVILANKNNKKYCFNKHSGEDPNTFKSILGTKRFTRNSLNTAEYANYQTKATKKILIKRELPCEQFSCELCPGQFLQLEELIIHKKCNHKNIPLEKKLVANGAGLTSQVFNSQKTARVKVNLEKNCFSTNLVKQPIKTTAMEEFMEEPIGDLEMKLFVEKQFPVVEHIPAAVDIKRTIVNKLFKPIRDESASNKCQPTDFNNELQKSSYESTLLSTIASNQHKLQVYQKLCTNLTQQRTVKLYQQLKLKQQQQQQPQPHQHLQQQQEPAFQLTGIKQETNNQVWQQLQLLQQQQQPQQQQSPPRSGQAPPYKPKWVRLG